MQTATKQDVAASIGFVVQTYRNGQWFDQQSSLAHAYERPAYCGTVAEAQLIITRLQHDTVRSAVRVLCTVLVDGYPMDKLVGRAMLTMVQK
jgi:hypothetical protein